jgi:hypothetical protein
MLRRKIYKWHRVLSLLAAVPMIMWSVSGMLHQAGAWAKPKLAKESVAPAKFSESDLAISLSEALERNRIEKMEDFQVVAYAGELYYQVRVKKDAPHIYLSATDGRELEKGEERYAVKLAFEMLGDANAQITHREFITQFSEKYRVSAKVLPVYCIMLKDENHTSIFIDTWNRKVTFADNKQRHAFHKWFGYLHSWKFLNGYPYTKAIALTAYSLIAFIAAVAGIYLYLLLPAISKEKLAKNSLQRRRNYHRWIGIIASLSMLLFSFSGALHALVDILPVDKTGEPWHKQIFNHLHMFRFTNAVSKDFRFWLLMLLAFINFLTVATGLAMMTRFLTRRAREKKVVKRVMQPAFS